MTKAQREIKLKLTVRSERIIKNIVIPESMTCILKNSNTTFHLVHEFLAAFSENFFIKIFCLEDMEASNTQNDTDHQNEH